MSDMPEGPAPSGSPHTTPPDGLTRFFDGIRRTRIVRGDDRWFAGVLGGIALRTGIAPIALRLIVIVLAIVGAPALFAYVVAWALLPDQEGRIHAEQALRGVFEPVIIAIGLLLIVSFEPFTRDLFWRWMQPIAGLPEWVSTTFSVTWGIAVTIGIIVLVVYVVRQIAAREAGTAGPGGPGPSPADGEPALGGPASRRGAAAFSPAAAAQRDTRPGAAATAIVLGLALTAGAFAAAVFSRGDFTTETLVVGLAVVLAVLALGIITAGIVGRRSGGMGGFALLAVVALVPLAVFPPGTQLVPFGSPYWGVGADTGQQGFAIIAGQPVIDLSELDTARGVDQPAVEVWLGTGEVEVIVPADGQVRVESYVMIGAIEFDDPSLGDRGGFFLRDSRTLGDGGSLNVPVVRVWTLIGQITVTDPTG